MKFAYRHPIIFTAVIFHLFSPTIKSVASASVVVFPLDDQFYVISTNRADDDGEVLPDCLVLGDSMGAATHANDACDRAPGDHRELMDCLELRLGSHDSEWSYMGGSKKWSIASRICTGDVYNMSRDGDEWKDALDRSHDIMETAKIGKVILNLGNNDVCAKYQHDYGSLFFVQPKTPGNAVSIEAVSFNRAI